ncbi:MAG: hypothetical protein ACI4TI_00735 [Christensenellales bacterium]
MDTEDKKPQNGSTGKASSASKKPVAKTASPKQAPQKASTASAGKSEQNPVVSKKSQNVESPKPNVSPKSSSAKQGVNSAKPVAGKSGAEKPSPLGPAGATKPPIGSAKPSTGPAKPTGSAKNASGDSRPNIKAVDATNVEVKQDDTENKKKKKKLLLLLLLLLLLFAGLGVGIYFMTRIPTADIRFSVSIQTYLNNTEIDSGGETREIIYWPGDTLDAGLTIKVVNSKGAITEAERVFLRFKIEVFVEDNYVGGLFDPDFEYPAEWSYSEADNYFYYNYFCYGNETIKPFSYLDFVADRANNILNGKSAHLVFRVEILEGNYSAISSEWNTAPLLWRPIKKVTD